MVIFGALSATAVGVGGYFGLYHLAPSIMIRPFRSPRVDRTVTPAGFGLYSEPFDFHTADGHRLRGWYFPAPAARGTVVGLHGIGSCRQHLLGEAKLLRSLGFNVILYDSRAMGESEGTYCTYGHFETRDLSRALDEAVARHGAEAPFGVFGESFGGAVALQALAREPRLAFGIVVSTFASLREISYDYFKLYTGVRATRFTDFMLNRAGALAGFEPDAIAPAEAAKSVVQPVLLMHGTDDRNIAIAYGERIFANLASPSKTWVAVPGADHYTVREKARADYERRITDFLETVSA
jgi:alpha-beta hydrolase superfamily lysophospholipase